MSPALAVVSGAQTVAVLGRLGFTQVSQKGSHVKMRRADRVAIVPMHRELAGGTLRSVLRQAGITVEDFRAAL